MRVGDNIQTCPDGSPRDTDKIDSATGAYGVCDTSDDPDPTPEPDEDAPENDGIPPGVDDTATCPDGSPHGMNKIDPTTGVYGYCPTSNDETPGDDENLGDDENPGDDAPDDGKNPGDEQPGDDGNPGEDENPGERNPGDKPDTPKNDGREAGTESTGPVVTGTQVTVLGGAVLALLVGDVAAARLVRKNSKDP